MILDTVKCYEGNKTVHEWGGHVRPLCIGGSGRLFWFDTICTETWMVGWKWPCKELRQEHFWQRKSRKAERWEPI